MSSLVPLSEFQSRNGLGQASSIVSRANYALAGATLHIEAYLRTYFERMIDVVTMYNVDSRQEPWLGESVMLYMPQGFVESVTEVRMSYTFPVLDDSELIDPSRYTINKEKGLLLLPPMLFEGLRGTGLTGYDKMYFSVKHTGGLELSADGDYQGVPGWLKEAAMSAAKVLFSEDCGCDGDASGCQELVNSIIKGLLVRHMRFYPAAIKPVV